MASDAFIFNQLSGYIGWKDANFVYQGCNTNLARVMGFKDANDIKGLMDSQLSGLEDENLLQFHRANDELALSGKTVKAIHCSQQPYDGSYFYFIKKPLFNDANKIIGIIYHCQEFGHSEIFLPLKKVEPGANIHSHYYLDAHHNPYHLSARELESLFFLLRGKTARQIAQLLTLSKRTVESYVEQIRNKFGCQNKAELFNLAIRSGYLNVIPPRLLETAKNWD